MTPEPQDTRIPEYIHAIERLQAGQYEIDLPVTPPDPLGQLGAALNSLAQNIEDRYREAETLHTITEHINAGLLLDDVMEHVYTEFRGLIPYNRIGFSLIEASEHGPVLRARWAKSDLPEVHLRQGYTALLAGSSLETIITTGQPRIINNLREYAQQKPESQSTQLILQEDILSSLTCPLINNGNPVGFIFFSSSVPNAYQDMHIALFQQIAAQLSTILEKSRLVSEIIDQRAAIDRQNQELLRLNDLKNTFLGIAAHDLRNPIGNVQMAVDLLMMDHSGLDKVEEQQILGEIRQQTQFMINLLSDLLDVSEIESGKLNLQRSRIDITAFLQETAARHRKLASPKGTHIEWECSLADYVEADAGRMRQIMDNLISNAVKYSPAGSTVKIFCRSDRDSCFFSVQDQGPGITPDDRKRLFQDFAKLSARPTGGEKSTGLGLSIVRRIVEAHEGVIGVESEPGNGATFWFSLPRIVRG